jgi:Flp pilus assembly pilin Flp
MNERGQAFTEYTMMLGLLAAIIVALTGLIVPAVGKIMVSFVQHVAVYVSSVD